MYIVIVHHEHANDSPSYEDVFGPFELEDAKKALVDLAAVWNKDRDWTFDGHFYVSDDGLYLGGDDEKNPEDAACCDIWGEVWAVIQELKEPGSTLT